MENASKALIIAGSVLIAMVVLSILVWGWNRVAKYYESEEGVETVQQIYKKNKELESYNKQLVRGYELRSLYNLIEDMNTRYAEEQGYIPITAQLKLIKYDLDKPMNEGGNGNIELPVNIEYKKDTTTVSIPRAGLWEFSNKYNNTLCNFMEGVYHKFYENSGDSQSKKIFNESYFRCVDIKYNGELEGQDGKGTARVQSFKFEQIVRK